MSKHLLNTRTVVDSKVYAHPHPNPLPRGEGVAVRRVDIFQRSCCKCSVGAGREHLIGGLCAR
jgi:hypothetical protein